MCEFQDMTTRKMIGVAEEHNGLYILHEADHPKEKQPTIACSSQSVSASATIWLQHYRLGLPPFPLLKTMFPHLFKSSHPSMFQCDVCVLSKHHRVSYPISNKLSSKPFSLVHSDVWASSKIPNCFRAQWFVSFIDSHVLGISIKREGCNYYYLALFLQNGFNSIWYIYTKIQNK